MKLTVLGSSSLANGYILSNGKESLVVECGVKLSEVKKALKFNLTTLVGALSSHSHDDHSKYITEYLTAGVPVLALSETFQAKRIEHHGAKSVLPGKGYIVGNYRVMPFEVAHDVPCLGFLIEHPEMGRLVFLTDTFLCEYTFPKVNHWLIEANYADDILEQNIVSGRINGVMRRRLMSTHMEIETTKGILQANDLSSTNTITLIHLSSGNSHVERFKREIEELTGIPTYIADKGLEIELNKDVCF